VPMARPHGFLSGWRPADGGSGNHRTGPASVYGATGMRGACYVTFFAFFGVFAFFAFARCGVVGAAALVLVSPGAAPICRHIALPQSQVSHSPRIAFTDWAAYGRPHSFR
jgi:hypothetical protein